MINIMSKIKITKICDECIKHKGFDYRGCYGTDCNDACCRYGCDVDKTAYEEIHKNSGLIKEILGYDFDRLFTGKFEYDDEYPGGYYIRSRKLKETGYCIFHKVGEKGCVLYELALMRGLPKKIVPLICKLYPLEWGNGELTLDHLEQKSCNVFREDNKSDYSIMETQKDTLEEHFDY